MKDHCLALLTEQGSLTDLMTRLMGHSPVLECLSQGKQSIFFGERELLGIKPRQLAHVREITLGTKQLPWLFARTIIPLHTLRGSARRLSRMNMKPLGKVLFGSFRAQRLNLQLDRVFAEEVDLGDFDIPKDFLLWQRRSVFQLSTGPLLISEIFLPDSPVYEITKK